jgi:hypothetical protein
MNVIKRSLYGSAQYAGKIRCDLRSDTGRSRYGIFIPAHVCTKVNSYLATVPSAGMLEAMRNAPVGDDVLGVNKHTIVKS